MNENLKPSEACFALIEQSESFVGSAYLDTGGVPTIAWGHTDGVKIGDVCDKAQGSIWLAGDVLEAEGIVKRAVKVPLTQNQFDALVSFVFNVGAGQKGVASGFSVLKSGRPSTLLRLINEENPGSKDPTTGVVTGAAAEFDKWVYDNGAKLNGLVTRRKREQALFLKA
jgi:lysozyme